MDNNSSLLETSEEEYVLRGEGEGGGYIHIAHCDKNKTLAFYYIYDLTYLWCYLPLLGT